MAAREHCILLIDAERGDQRSHQRPSERPSERRSEAIRGHQRPSEAIREAIRGHQRGDQTCIPRPSERRSDLIRTCIPRRNPMRSDLISGHYLLEAELTGVLGHVALAAERVVLNCDERHLMRRPRLDGRHELCRRGRRSVAISGDQWQSSSYQSIVSGNVDRQWQCRGDSRGLPPPACMCSLRRPHSPQVTPGDSRGLEGHPSGHQKASTWRAAIKAIRGPQIAIKRQAPGAVRKAIRGPQIAIKRQAPGAARDRP